MSQLHLGFFILVMEKNIKDYLHLYLGCEGILKRKIYPKTETKIILRTDILHLVSAGKNNEFKPILRLLSNITEYEANLIAEHENFVVNYRQNSEEELILEWHAEKTIYLLSKHFDLFGLIEAGLAIDAATLK